MADIEERDLTQEDGQLDNEQAVRAIQPQSLSLEPFNLEKEQEKIRARIAEGLVILLAAVIALAFVTLWSFGKSFADLEKLITIIFAPVVALVGTAIGYYFGGKTSSQKTQ